MADADERSDVLEGIATNFCCWVSARRDGWTLLQLELLGRCRCSLPRLPTLGSVSCLYLTVSTPWRLFFVSDTTLHHHLTS